MFETRMDLCNMTEQPFLNEILHTGPPSATLPDLDFSWTAGPPSAGLTSPLISPTTRFDTYCAADPVFPLKRRASGASEPNIEEVLGQPQVSSLVQADLYAPPPPTTQVYSSLFVQIVITWKILRDSVANVSDPHTQGSILLGSRPHLYTHHPPATIPYLEQAPRQKRGPKVPSGHNVGSSSVSLNRTPPEYPRLAIPVQLPGSREAGFREPQPYTSH